MRGPVLSSLGTRPPLWREARIGLEAAALVRDRIFRGDGLEEGRAVFSSYPVAENPERRDHNVAIRFAECS